MFDQLNTDDAMMYLKSKYMNMNKEDPRKV